jgi:hypothetical protein
MQSMRRFHMAGAIDKNPKPLTLKASHPSLHVITLAGGQQQQQQGCREPCIQQSTHALCVVPCAPVLRSASNVGLIKWTRWATYVRKMMGTKQIQMKYAWLRDTCVCVCVCVFARARVKGEGGGDKRW